MRSKLTIITMGWYNTFTFDLIRHGLWPVTPSPPGEGFSLTRQPLRRFLLLRYRQVSGRGMPPPLQNFAGKFVHNPLLPERGFFFSLHPFRQENFIRCDTLVPTIFLERQGYL